MTNVEQEIYLNEIIFRSMEIFAETNYVNALNEAHRFMETVSGSIILNLESASMDLQVHEALEKYKTQSKEATHHLSYIKAKQQDTAEDKSSRERLETVLNQRRVRSDVGNKYRRAAQFRRDAVERFTTKLVQMPVKDKLNLVATVILPSLSLIVAGYALQPNEAQSRSADALDRIAIASEYIAAEKSQQTEKLSEIQYLLHELNGYVASDQDGSEDEMDKLLMKIVAYVKNLEEDNADGPLEVCDD